MSISWEAAGTSDVGRLRKGNEDALRVDPTRGIFLVADGMGGHAAGEVASELAASTVAARIGEAVDGGATGEEIDAALRDAAAAAHRAIEECCRGTPDTRGMGTTLTTCILDAASGSAHIGHIGDSRLYRLRQGALQQVTRDHTWVQREVDAGRLSPDEARSHPFTHIVTRVLSEDLEPEIDLETLTLTPGDLLLLCTDGLHNMLDDDDLTTILQRGPIALATTVADLVDAANDAGGTDNITALLIRILPN